jgi:uncharacterized protein with LGFP repeats
MHIVRGAVLDKYRALGGPASGLGYPTADYVAVPSMNAAYTNFQGGDLIWSQAAGAHYVRGGILRTWLWTGGAAGYLGFPTADEVALPNASSPVGYVSDFQHGSIYWSAATSMHIVRGAVLDKYRLLGGPASGLGYPTADYVTTSGRTGPGASTSFQGGAIYWSSGTGAHWLPSAVNQAYLAAGGTSSSYGYPVSDPSAVSGGQRVDFQSGSLIR